MQKHPEAKFNFCQFEMLTVTYQVPCSLIYEPDTKKQAAKVKRF